MNILVTGSTGFIGSALVFYLRKEGHGVTRLVRRQMTSSERQVIWDPGEGTIDAQSLAGTDAVVHLAGESLGPRRWTAQRMSSIRDSRVKGTRLLSEALARLEPLPQVMASASAIGYYGDRGDQLLREESGPGSGFLAETVRLWEEATEPAALAGVRVVNLRMATVLGTTGGLLSRMLPAFKLGLGARLGSGQHYMSWISMHDLLRAILHTLAEGSLKGPVNIAAPGAVTSAEFTRTLGHVLSRPTWARAPRLALALVFGELADALLASARVDPARLMDSGFRFQYPDLEGALRAMLGRPKS